MWFLSQMYLKSLLKTRANWVLISFAYIKHTLNFQVAKLLFTHCSCNLHYSRLIQYLLFKNLKYILLLDATSCLQTSTLTWLSQMWFITVCRHQREARISTLTLTDEGNTDWQVPFCFCIMSPVSWLWKRGKKNLIMLSLGMQFQKAKQIDLMICLQTIFQLTVTALCYMVQWSKFSSASQKQVLVFLFKWIVHEKH